MTGRILANVQPHQEQAEHGQATQAVEQSAIGDHPHAASVQGAVAQLQRTTQLGAILQDFRRRWLAVLDGRAGPLTCRPQALAQRLEQDAIGLGRVAALAQQFVTGLAHGQRGNQPFYLAQVEIGGHPTGGQQHLARHHRGDVRVAVAVAPHPGGEADRRGLQWQVQAGEAVQGRVSLAQHVGHRLPQRILDGSETPLGLFHWGRPVATYLLGVPHLCDQALQAQLDARLLGVGEIGVIPCRQLLGDGVVLLDQRAARYLGGMRGEHQFDFQAADLPRDELVVVPGRLETLDEIGEHPDLERRRLACGAPAHLMVLLGDIGQIEKLVERPGHGQQFALVETVERFGQ